MIYITHKDINTNDVAAYLSFHAHTVKCIKCDKRLSWAAAPCEHELHQAYKHIQTMYYALNKEQNYNVYCERTYTTVITKDEIQDYCDLFNR